MAAIFRELLTVKTVCLYVPLQKIMSRQSSGASFKSADIRANVGLALTSDASSTDAVEAVDIISDDGLGYSVVTVAEGDRAVTDFEVNVGDRNVTYQINDGDDRDLFEIDKRTGELSFKQGADWEQPQDADGNNVYEVNVIALGDRAGDGHFLSVVVDNESDSGPVEITSDDTGAPDNDYTYIEIQENTLQVTDVELSAAETGVTYSLNAGADQDLFTIDAETGELSFKQAPDFENPTDNASETAVGEDNYYEVNVLAVRDGVADSQYLTVAVTNEKEASDPVSIYLMAGQSNLVGEALAENLEPAYAEPFEAAQIWSQTNGEFATLAPGVAEGASEATDEQTTVGPELSFARQIAERSEKAVYIVKYGQGSTSLAEDWNPNGGRQYNTFTQTVDAALSALKADGRRYEIDGLVWMQGESDTYEDRFAPQYQDNLTNFVGNMRELYGDELDIAIGLVRGDLPTSKENLGLVRAAQQAVAEADPQVTLVDTDALGVAEDVMRVDIDDFTHYNAAGQVLLGNAFGEAFAV